MATQFDLWYGAWIQDTAYSYARTDPGILQSNIIDTTASGTEILFAKFITPPVQAAVTISGAVTFNLWALESSMFANVGFRARLFKYSPGINGTETEMGGSPFDDGAEFGTSAALMTWTGTPTSNNVLAAGDRIVIKIYATNIGTMAAPYTATFYHSDSTPAGSNGDSFVQFTETFNQSEDVDQYTFRFRNDDGSETTATWNAAADTNISLAPETVLRLRVGLKRLDPLDGSAVVSTIEFSKNGGAWTSLTSISSGTQLALSSNITQGGATTQQITSGTFEAGALSESAASATMPAVAGASKEHEMSFKIVSGETAGTTFDYRVRQTSGVQSYGQSKLPRVTVLAAGSTAAASGTGTLAAVGRGTAASAASAAGTGAVAAVGVAIKAGAIGAASGLGAVAAVGSAVKPATAAASGTGALAAVGLAIFGGAVSAAGVGAATAVGRGTAASAVAAAGTGNVAAVGRGIAAATASASGSGDVAAVGAALSIISAIARFFGGASDYDGDAARFEAVSRLTRTSAYSGAGSSFVGTFSAWINITGAPASRQAIMDTGVLDFEITLADTIRFSLSIGAMEWQTAKTYTDTIPDGWIHILASWDTNFSAGNKLFQLYVNDVADVGSKIDNVAATSIAWNEIGIDIGFGGGTRYLYAEMTEYYHNIATRLDLSVESNRRKFISAAGTPVNLGSDGSVPTGTAPIAYLKLDPTDAAAAIATNRGTGGDFTLSGSPFIKSITDPFGKPSVAVGRAFAGGAVSAAGVGAVAAVGAAAGFTSGVVAADGTGALAAVGASFAAAAVLAAGVGTSTAVGRGTAASAASAAGTGTATGIGQAIFAGVIAAAAGTSTVTAVGSAVKPAAIAAAGTGTATIVGAGIAASAIAAAGTGTASGVGRGIAAAVASAAGTSNLNGLSEPGSYVTAAGNGALAAVGRGTAASAASAAGTSTTVAVGRGIAAATASAAGTSTVTAVGRGTAASAVSAAGTSTVTAVGRGIFAGAISAAGTGTASGIGRGIAAAIIAAAGTSSLTAVSPTTAGRSALLLLNVG